MKLSTCLHQFFDYYLPRIKGNAENTIKTYRDAFTLFLPFAAKQLSIKIESIRVEHLSTPLILAFLDYLESERYNTAKSRNQRLAALKSLAIMIRFMYPENKEIAKTILRIPQKRTQKPLVAFLDYEDIFNVFQSVDLKKKTAFVTIPSCTCSMTPVSGPPRQQPLISTTLILKKEPSPSEEKEIIIDSLPFGLSLHSSSNDI